MNRDKQLTRSERCKEARKKPEKKRKKWKPGEYNTMIMEKVNNDFMEELEIRINRNNTIVKQNSLLS